MGVKKMELKKFVSLLIIMSFFICSVGPVFAKTNENIIQKVLSELNNLSGGIRSLAFSFLRDYFKTPEKLDKLKKDMPKLLNLAIGKDHGLPLDKINAQIDELKDWSTEDRMKLLDSAEANDTQKILELFEKYQKTDTSSDNEDKEDKEKDKTETKDTDKTDKNKDEKTKDKDKKQNKKLEDIKNQIKVNFQDIQNHWAKNYIEKIAQKGIIKGRAPGQFAPNDNITRAEFVTMLCRLLDLEEIEDKDIPFDDVSKEDWFYDTAKTAYHAGLVKGKGKNFDPNGLITRQELITFINRAATMQGKSISLDENQIEQILSNFSDRKAIPSWARAEIASAVKLGLASGTTENTFSPKDNATRAQAATAIYNLCLII